MSTCLCFCFLPLQGEQFVFYEDWGEALVGKSCPVLCVLDIEGDNVSVLEGVPDDISPGQVATAILAMMQFLFSLCTKILLKPSCLFRCFLFRSICLCRHFGLQGTQAWCLWAGGMSLSELASSTVPTGGDHCQHRSIRKMNTCLSRLTCSYSPLSFLR